MKSYRSFITLSFALIILAGYQFIGAAWTPAPSTPPGDNADAPINVGATTQSKSGNLNANIFAATTEMRSNRYCDALGNNCSIVGGVSTSTNSLSDCFLGYRFRRNGTANVWQYIKLDGTSNDGAWSTWSVSSLNDECNGPGCGVQMKIVCDATEDDLSDWVVGTWGACSASSCGAYGTQTRSVTCVNPSGVTVADSYCTATKPDTTQSCRGYCPPAERSCFTADTIVTMEDGTQKLIKDVAIGDKVLGESNAINTVLGYDRPMLGGRQLYSLNQGPYFVTAEHPFKTTDGWKSISPEALLEEEPSLAEELNPTKLEIGDQIINEDGTLTTITSIEGKTANDQLLYNLVLDGNNTYFVNGLLTHNKKD